MCMPVSVFKGKVKKAEIDWVDAHRRGLVILSLRLLAKETFIP